MSVITIRLDGVPVGKGRPRFSRNGAAYTPAKTRAYEGNLAYAASQAMNGRALLEGPLAVTVVALFAVPASASRKKQLDMLQGAIRPAKKPDADNILKNLDALNGIVFRDDAQVVDVTLRKLYSAKPGFSITIEPACMTRLAL